MSALALIVLLAGASIPAGELVAPPRIPGIDASIGAQGSASAVFSFALPQRVFASFLSLDASVEWRAEFPFAIRARLWPLLFRTVLSQPPAVLGSLEAMFDLHLVGLGLGVGPGSATPRAMVPEEPLQAEAVTLLPLVRLGGRDGLMASFQLRFALGPTVRRMWVGSIAGFEARVQVPLSANVRLVARAAGAWLGRDALAGFGFGELGLRLPLGGGRSRLGLTMTAGVGYAGAIGPLAGLAVDWRG